MTTIERMKSGKLYTDLCEGLPERRLRGKELCYDFNHTRPREEERRQIILRQLFASLGKNPWIEPPLSVAYFEKFLLFNAGFSPVIAFYNFFCFLHLSTI